MQLSPTFLLIIPSLCYQFGDAIREIAIDEVGFYLFTPRNPKESETLKINDSELLNASNFSKEWPVRFIIHGYESSKDSELNIIIRDEYLKKGDFNIIVVDWSYYSHSLYPIAMEQVQPVGRYTGQFSKFLESEGVPFENMYLIGHSLGAHIAGIAGNYIAPSQYDTIFALDPARPGFEFVPLERRIDSSDAKYVESIQTDTNVIGVGMIEPAGTASFYPNFLHTVQPGCNEISCSHTRSIDYFAESINSVVGFLGKLFPLAGSYVRMGGEPSTHKKGIYFLPTNARPPYAKGRWTSLF